MTRFLLRSVLSLSLLSHPFLAGCASARAERVQARALVPIAAAPDAVRAPYRVEIVDDGASLDTFYHRGRYYVHGAHGERYAIRVSNPTAQRIEAVVSVDGLDVVDGENGDLRKRGYIVPAYGEVIIEGWRTSLNDVAAFRFSSVSGSYAGRKGKARNVGVIAVALFAERPVPAPPLIIGGGRRPWYGEEVERHLDRGVPGAADKQTRAPSSSGAGRGAATAESAAPPSAAESAPSTAARAGAPAPTSRDQACCGEPTKNERLGLGTEFGEQRSSAASYTSFVRASGSPIAVAELRYNDTAGLRALGIVFDQIPDEAEIMTRERAEPFPGDRGFARAPGGYR